MNVQEVLSQKVIQRCSLWHDETALTDKELKVLGKKVFCVGDLEEGVVGMTW